MPVEQNKEKSKTAKQQHTNKPNKQGKVNGWPVRNVSNWRKGDIIVSSKVLAQ